MQSSSRPWQSIFSSTLRSTLVAAAAVYLAMNDKLSGVDLVVVLSGLGAGVSLPWVVTKAISKKDDGHVR